MGTPEEIQPSYRDSDPPADVSPFTAEIREGVDDKAFEVHRPADFEPDLARSWADLPDIPPPLEIIEDPDDSV